MAHTLQTRVVALVGLGVFAAVAVLTLLARDALLTLEQSIEAERARVASSLASSLARDVMADEAILDEAAAAPTGDLQEGATGPERRALASALRMSHLGSAVCFTNARGEPLACEPVRQLARVDRPAVTVRAAAAIARGRPIATDAVDLGDGEVLLLVVPMAQPHGEAAGAVFEVIDPADARLRSLMRPSADLSASLLDGTRRRMTAWDAASSAAVVESAVDGTPWTLQVRTIREGAGSPVARFRRTSLWLAPLLAATAALLAWGIAWSVRRPVTALTRAAERIASGNLSEAVPVGSADEIGRLSVALEEMRVRLQASIARIETANTELEDRVRARTAALRHLMGRVIGAQEDERRRVARELHDETAQLVAALGMGLQRVADASDPDTAAHLRGLGDVVDRLHEGLHRLIVNLRPSVLDDLGLASAIQWLADQQLAARGIAVRCELGDLRDLRLPRDIEVAVFRVVQETLSNIARHAAAEQVLIQGSLAGGHLHIEIEDDGVGFEVRHATETGSLRGVGLVGMRERAELVGGALEIESAPGEGTRVHIEVPAVPELAMEAVR